MADDYQIAIIGAGPAGLATALHLQRLAPELAAQTVIFESAIHPRHKLCGGGVTFHGEEQLRALGLAINVPATSIDTLHFRLGHCVFQTRYPNAMRIVQRADFDSALADAAHQRGLRLHANERLLDLQLHAASVELRTTRGSYQVKAVVGADGANSTVRQRLSMRSTVGVARLLHVMTPSHPHVDRKGAYFDFSCIIDGVQGYTWDFPCLIDGQPFVNRGIFDSRIATEGRPKRGQLRGQFEMGLTRRGVRQAERRLEGHPVRWFNPDAEFSRPRLLLVGDAAGVDPLFAEGISYGMEYGALAATMLHEAVQRDDFSFADYRDRIVGGPLGQSLQRRARLARSLYRHQRPQLWTVLWRLAAIAPPVVKQSIGAALGVLPPPRRGE
ncbi:MAG: NAD(P)/FAD-dependent oxidoreductase [Anaerolineales bacterium]|nr:NAD(P)/FAD-dependent oxidoreductase [Anaerolineales bacterium]MCB9127111.1 NAD(P)/FAD-dependent oxidoreductase [Ardenticatenales bacterium]